MFRVCNVSMASQYPLMQSERMTLYSLCSFLRFESALSTIFDLVIVAGNLIDTQEVYSWFVARTSMYAMSK